MPGLPSFAHESGHTNYYQDPGILKMIKFGIKYGVDPDFRIVHERSTDKQLIYQGLGIPLYKYAAFVRKDPSAYELFQSIGHFLDTYYLSDDEILNELKPETL